MGIPSYFSYIVKNHQRILKKINYDLLKIDNLYIDSNSIIYDSIYEIINQYKDNNSFELILIETVCKKLQDYINLLSPSNNVIVAFDGVAPIAKLEQQRTRRYKSWFIESANSQINSKKEKLPWDKTAITPGTEFMNKLNANVSSYFKKNKSSFKAKNIIISGSDVPGEGEHKIFEYIRHNKDIHKEEITVIHGLDADLIMLCLNHLHISDNIHLFRETPHFIKNISNDLDPNETYLINIKELGDNIVEDLGNESSISVQEKNKIIHDYIFICLFLGNDFMPHFPSINIRTNGINILLNAYKHVLSDKNEFLLKDNKIIWKNVRSFIKYLAENENRYFREEYKLRDRYEKQFLAKNTVEEKEKYFNLIPTKEREIEKYINPFEYAWEKRYYKMLFDVEIDDSRRKQICTNYMEALEWNIEYYTNGCKNWDWCYHYHYAPLLCDLSKFLPYFDTEFVEFKTQNPVTPYIQLAYVLPRNSLYLLPFHIRQELMLHYEKYYKLDFRFKWAFCKYFWESHVDMPRIDIEKLKEITINT